MKHFIKIMEQLENCEPNGDKNIKYSQKPKMQRTIESVVDNGEHEIKHFKPGNHFTSEMRMPSNKVRGGGGGEGGEESNYKKKKGPLPIFLPQTSTLPLYSKGYELQSKYNTLKKS